MFPPAVQINDPFLQNYGPAEQLQVLLGFTAWCRMGVWGRGRQVRADNIAVAVWHVAQIYELAGYPGPRKPAGGGDMYISFTRLFHSFPHSDPASEPHIGLLIKVFLNIVEIESSS
jgi:hypothetical protein